MSWLDNKDDFYNTGFGENEIDNEISIFKLNQRVDYSIDLDDYKLPSTSKESKEVSEVNAQNIFKERTYIDSHLLDELRVENKQFYCDGSDSIYKQQRERTKLLLKKTRRDERGSEVEFTSHTSEGITEVKKRGRKKKIEKVYTDAGISSGDIKKLKNREAAQKSRLKKQTELDELRVKEHKLEDENLLLKNELQKLKESVRNCSNCRSVFATTASRPVIIDTAFTGGTSKKCLLVTGILAIICIFTTLLSSSSDVYSSPHIAQRILQSFNNSEFTPSNKPLTSNKKKGNPVINPLDKHKCNNNFLSNVSPPVHYHDEADPSPLRINMDITKENISLFCDDCYFTLDKSSFNDLKQTVKVCYTST
jgi:hypothetical protein